MYASNAEGWDRNDIKMDGKSSLNNKSTWNVDGIFEDGFYDIEIEAVIEKESYADRKWYNMSKKELCVNYVVEETSSKYRDTNEQDDY